MTVTCTNLAQFIELVAGFVREGLTFRGDADRLEIILLGGF
jgi:hypothetical protein